MIIILKLKKNIWRINLKKHLIKNMIIEIIIKIIEYDIIIIEGEEEEIIGEIITNIEDIMIIMDFSIMEDKITTIGENNKIKL